MTESSIATDDEFDSDGKSASGRRKDSQADIDAIMGKVRRNSPKASENPSALDSTALSLKRSVFKRTGETALLK